MLNSTKDILEWFDEHSAIAVYWKIYAGHDKRDGTLVRDLYSAENDTLKSREALERALKRYDGVGATLHIALYEDINKPQIPKASQNILIYANNANGGKTNGGAINGLPTATGGGDIQELIKLHTENAVLKLQLEQSKRDVENKINGIGAIVKDITKHPSFDFNALMHTIFGAKQQAIPQQAAMQPQQAATVTQPGANDTGEQQNVKYNYNAALVVRDLTRITDRLGIQEHRELVLTKFAEKLEKMTDADIQKLFAEIF